MPTVLNKTERLIHTHDGTMIPPGVPTEISDEALANETIAQAISDGMLENTTVAGTARQENNQQRQTQNPQPQPNQQTQPRPQQGTKNE